MEIDEKAKILAENKFVKWVDTPFEYCIVIILLSLFFSLMYKTFGFPGMISIGFACIITSLGLIQRELKKK